MKRERITVYPASTTERGAKPIQRVPYDFQEDWTNENGGQWRQQCWVRYKGDQLHVVRYSHEQEHKFAHVWGPWLAFYYAPKRGNGYYLGEQERDLGWPHNPPRQLQEVR